jgi:hypothetical protein
MKTIIKNYIRQPSTWLGLAKLGAALGLYSTGAGGAIVTAIVGVFGVIDVVRNERGQKPLE